MSHEILIENGRTHIAYVGDKPWHQLGTQVGEFITGPQMLRAAGLDWAVTKRGLPTKQGKVNRYKITRTSAGGRSVLLGTTGAEYVPLQNADAIRYFEPILDRLGGCFDVAGALGQGERIWILGRLELQDEVVDGDPVDHYLLFSNRHDGQGDIEVSLTPIRVVCSNTMSLSNQFNDQRLLFRHDAGLQFTLGDPGRIAEVLQAQRATCVETFRRMASTSIAGRWLNIYLDRTFGLLGGRARYPDLFGGAASQIMKRRWRLEQRLGDAWKAGQERFREMEYERLPAGSPFSKPDVDDPSYQALIQSHLAEKQRINNVVKSLKDRLDRLDQLEIETGTLNEQRWLVARQLFDTGRGNQLPGVRGTLWAAYNAVTETVDHTPLGGWSIPAGSTKNSTVNNPEQRFQAVMFGAGQAIKSRALSQAVAMMDEGFGSAGDSISLARDWMSHRYQD